MCEHCMRPGYFGQVSQSSLPMPAESVLACTECSNPLERTATGGYRCATCNYAPSMQDTFIFYRCPQCRTRLIGHDLTIVCRGCGTKCVKR
jgi:hypothetical protein